MNNKLINILVVTLFPVFFHSCQKSGQTELENFPSKWYFLGENEAGDPVFYLSCDGESTVIKIEKLEESDVLIIEEKGELFENFWIQSFNLNEDNTGEFSLTDPNKTKHTLRFEYTEDKSTASWSLDGQLIGRFIAGKMPDEIEKIYPPCIECFPFDECLDRITDPAEYIEMINSAIEGSYEGMSRKDKTTTDMDGFSGAEYEVHYLKGMPVKVISNYEAGAYLSDRDIYYLREGDLVESRHSENTRSMMEGEEMTQEASTVYFRDGIPVRVERKYLEITDPGEFINAETSLPGFDELAFSGITFDRDSMLKTLEFECKDLIARIEGSGTFEGEFVELYLRFDENYSLQIRDPLDKIHYMIVLEPDEWIRELLQSTEMPEGREALVTWRYWESENEDGFTSTEPVYRHAVWLDEIRHIYTEPNQIRGAIREYTEREYYCTETIEGDHYQYHPSCIQGSLGFSLEGNWDVPSFYESGYRVYHYNLKELMLLTDDRIRILYCLEDAVPGPTMGCLEIRPYEEGELVINQMYHPENTPTDAYTYCYIKDVYDKLPVSSEECEQ